MEALRVDRGMSELHFDQKKIRKKVGLGGGNRLWTLKSGQKSWIFECSKIALRIPPFDLSRRADSESG